ncbi:MAG: hypothetical protein GXY17_00855 [Clostridiaceae bacterium]|nr:hypothetical protein [Clostridiaceae bacterium]
MLKGWSADVITSWQLQGNEGGHGSNQSIMRRNGCRLFDLTMSECRTMNHNSTRDCAGARWETWTSTHPRPHEDK